MSTFLNQILDRIPYDTFTDTELGVFPFSSKASRYNQVKRALARGEIVQLRRGLYQLGKRYRRNPVNVYTLAVQIYGPSYVSFESALSYHGLIPEAVYSVISASVKRANEFKTVMGVFTYRPVPIKAFAEEIERIKDGKNIFLMATPLKALTDYVYSFKHDWTGVRPLIESLRIEPEDLVFETQAINDLIVAYHSRRVTRFLTGVKKDLGL